jgi:hypothetical protein
MILDSIKENVSQTAYSQAKVNSLKDESEDFTSNFVILLQETRTLNAKARKQKASIAESKILLDKLYLDQQNLNYQSQYLRKEIGKCEEQE